ncbi:MAG: biosynthetic-type acetolactate synthase large subunit [Bacteroidales bacterium]|nr:biosynthetic-type acetolactate synthase large subunit [Bacteroidales bacterium]
MEDKKGKIISGGEILLEQLLVQGVETVFGYPGGAIMPVYDKLYGYLDRLHHVLVRHEQGAIHAAQGYARVKGKPGFVVVTSGPGATNVITGVADAMIDSTPVVVVAGQVTSGLLGTDAFQETDLIGMTTPITKWSYQIRRAEDVAWAVSRAFFIAASGRPGPVVLDFTRDAQIGLAEFEPCHCDFIRSYVPDPEVPQADIEKAAAMINAAERPFVVYGQGILLSGAEKELGEFLDKGDIPAGSTLLGLSALPSDNPHFKGMLGMHGSIASNIMTCECDLLVAVGMRFDDRVTGKLEKYAAQAKIIHIDIDASEIGKNIPVDLGIIGDAKQVLARLTPLLEKRERSAWEHRNEACDAVERKCVCAPEIAPADGPVNPGEVIAAVAQATGGDAVIVTDVGQNQMLAARYSRFDRTRSFISSGGLGTMGFGLPAAIGAKIAAPERTVCLFVGDGGIQMTVQELGTIMQEKVGVKIVLLNNNWLGNVRMWQELFFGSRYSCTRLLNPDFAVLASAYGIRCENVESREELAPAIARMLADDAPCILNVHVREESMVFPMIPPGKELDQIMLNTKDWYDYGK